MADENEGNRGIAEIAVSTLGMLVNRVEWFEVDELDTGTGLGRVRDGINGTGAGGTLIFGTRSVGSQLDNVIKESSMSPDDGLGNGELVGGEGTGFVKLLSTSGESDGQDGVHGNQDTADQEDQGVVEAIAVGVVDRQGRGQASRRG